MHFPQNYVVRGDNPTGIVGITGAAPQQVNGNAIDAGRVAGVNPAAARVYAKATTSGLALAAKWQVLDDDNSTWIDVVESNNPNNVALLTGSGVAASVVKIVAAPIAASAGSRQTRLVVTSSGATGGGAGTDECSIAYEFRMPTTATGF